MADKEMAKQRRKKEKDRMIHVRLPESLHKQLRLLVAEEDTTIQDCVNAIIKKAMKK